MKKFKTFGSLFLAAALLIGMMQINVADCSAAKTGPVQRKAYLDFMGKNKSSKMPYLYGYSFRNAQTGAFKSKVKMFSQKAFMHYVFQDLNGDGVNEMVVSNIRDTNSTDRKVMICTYVNKKCVPVYCVGGLRNGIYAAKGNQICFGFGGSDTTTYVFSKLSGNKLKHVATYRQETVRKKGNKVAYCYYKNNKKTTKAQYKKAVAKLTTPLAV